MSDEQKVTNLDTMCVVRSGEESLDFLEATHSRDKRQRIANDAAEISETFHLKLQLQSLSAEVRFLRERLVCMEQAFGELKAAQVSTTVPAPAPMKVSFGTKISGDVDFPPISETKKRDKKSKAAKKTAEPDARPASNTSTTSSEPSPGVPGQPRKKSYSEVAKQTAFKTALQEIQTAEDSERTVLRPPSDPREHKFPAGIDALRASRSVICSMPGQLNADARKSRASQIAAWKVYLGLIHPPLRESAIIYPFDWGQRAEIFVPNLDALTAIQAAVACAKLVLLDSPDCLEHKAAPAFIARRARSYAFARCKDERHLLLQGLRLPLQEAILARALTSRSDVPPMLKKYVTADRLLCLDLSSLA